MNTIVTKIKELRSSNNITQEEVADRLGMSRPTYIAIESGKRELTVSELNRLAAIFYVRASDIFGDTTVEDTSEGNLQKYKQIILNVLHYGGDSSDGKLTKTKLAKLAYLADFAWYYNQLKPMSGLAYRRIQQGPVPNEYFRVVDELYEGGQITIEAKKDGKVMMISAVEDNPPQNKLSSEELGLIKRISKKWKDKNTADIVDFTHNQLPWKICRPGDIIPYSIIGQEDPDNVY